MTDSGDRHSREEPKEAEDSEEKVSAATVRTVDAQPQTTLAQGDPDPDLAVGDESSDVEPQTDVIDGRYDVLSLLGSGSMGNVYKVYDRELDEAVALKTLHARLVSDESAKRRFRREVKLARRVTHPNVARTYDLGYSGEVPYITMEFISGRSLLELLQTEGPLGSERLLSVIRPLCAGLQAAHGANVIHRDLKPQNVMVSGGRVVITDFGIARRLTSSVDISTTGSGMVGTPVYMAPEQVENRDGIDARADIYALGVMLFEMLTGSNPWTASSPVAIAFERCDRPPPKLPEDGEWPDVYREVVHRCMRREPEDRFDRVIEVARHLERASKHTYSTFETEVTTPAMTLPGTEGEKREDLAERLAPDLDMEVPFSGESVAVLPFEYSGPDEYEYLAVGLTEEVIDELSRTDGLGVLPLGTVSRFDDTDIDPREAGAELGVGVVVEGSVRRFGDSLRVRAAITSVEEGFQLWAERFETQPEQLLQVGATAADAIAEALTVESENEHREAPSDPVVIDLYMRARHEMYERWFSDLTPAIELYEKALERAPGDPRVLSGIATARARAAFVDPADRERHLEEAEEFAERAIDVAHDWPEPHFALGKVHFNRVQFGRALEAVDAALDRSADFAGAHALRGRMLAEIGPLETARRHLERALDLNPYDYNARWDLVRVFALQEEWRRADELLEEPVDSELHVVLRYANRTRFDLWREEPGWLETAAPDLPADSDFELLTPIMRRVTRGEELTESDRNHLDLAIDAASPDSRYLSLQHQFRAEIAARAGELDDALEAVECAHRTGLVDLNWLDFAPILGDLRGNDRFEAIRRDVRDRVDDLLVG